MSTPLTTLSRSGTDIQDDWQAFLERRGTLTRAMRLDVCDGCDQCGGRCTSGFLVSYDEYVAARLYLATLPPLEVARVLGQDKNVPWPGAEDISAAELGLEPPTVTLCRYRDVERDNCFLYPVRPTICRLFGHTEWLPCPIGAVPNCPDGAPAVWNDYRGFERETWEGWDALA